jgi:cobalt-zinc-cadmium efflux system outer membrane protein
MSSCRHEGSRMISDHFLNPMKWPVLTRRGTTRCTTGICLIALLVATPAGAQTRAASPLSLQVAMERAFAANPTIAAARLIREINLAGLAVARERLNPEAIVEFEKETPKQGFGLVIPLELGGKREKRIAVSEAAIRTGEAELSATIAQVRNDVRRAYFDVAVADARLAILRELRDLSRRVRDSAQARFESGESPRLEVLQADLAVAAADNEATAAEGVVFAATAKLNAVLGLPLDTVQQLSTALDAGESLVTRTVMDLAVSGSSELALLDRRIDEQRAKVAFAQALRVPDIIPTAMLTHDAQPEFTYGWRAGMAVTLPIFTSHRAGVMVEESTLAQLTAQREATLLRITGDVTAAAAIAEAQRLAYMRYRDVILPQAQQVEQLAQDSYDFGQTGIAALLQALQASRDVRLRSVDAAAQFQAALADLERAIGTPLP